MNESQYKWRLTVICPESLMTPANHLAVSIGEMLGDFYTFIQADWEDSQGNRYAIMSSAITDIFFQYAGSMLQRRDFAPDNWSFELATQAQMAVILWTGPTEQYPAFPQADPNKIIGIVDDNPINVLQSIGLVKIE